MVMESRLSKVSIGAVQKAITGDRLEGDRPAIAPYLSGPKLVTFFRNFGFEDDYGEGFPSRWAYVETRLEERNGTDSLARIVEAIVQPQRFLDTPFSVDDAVGYINKFLAFDGYQLSLTGKKYRFHKIDEPTADMEARLRLASASTHEFIEEQLTKCDRKLREDDFDGAITNARSLVEAVLFEIEGQLDSGRDEYDGDLPKLFKRVQKHLRLDPSRTDISDSLRQMLSGLIGIIAGLAPLRNKMGDAHVRSYKPAKHHARLAVNAAKTVCDFLIESLEYQKTKGLIGNGGKPGSNA
jgi:abortive infection Abi-like protein